MKRYEFIRSAIAAIVGHRIERDIDASGVLLFLKVSASSQAIVTSRLKLEGPTATPMCRAGARNHDSVSFLWLKVSM